MKEAWKLYDAGDVVGARRIARSVLAAPNAPEELESAQDLLRRTRLPPFLWVFALGAAALLAAVIALAAART